MQARGPKHVGPRLKFASIVAAWRVDAAPALALAALCAVYAIGVSRAWDAYGRGQGMRRRDVWCFAGTALTLALALVSPLDALSDDLFSAHMTQHVLLSVIAPPLLVLGAPHVAFAWALPRRARRSIVSAFTGDSLVRKCWLALTAPSVGWIVHAIAMWGWHAPKAYELALRSDPAHALEHLSFVGTACLVWWPIVHRRTTRQAAYGLGIMTLFATAMQTGVLGALIALSHHLLYPAQAMNTLRWGLGPLEDQQLAGLIMWIPGGLLYLAAMAVLFVRWLEPLDPAVLPSHLSLFPDHSISDAFFRR